MRGWLKVLLGIGAGFLILFTLGITLLLRSGRWEQVQRMAGGIFELKRGAEDLERFQKERTFTPPADGLIPESRLLTYLEICESLQPFVKPYEAWIEAHAGKQRDFKDAVEALGFMGKVTRHSAEVLRAKGMTPHELAWLHRSVRKAVEEAQAKGSSPELVDMLGDLRKAAGDPGISKALKTELLRKLERQESRIKAAGEPMSPNARLCLAHSDRIRRADLGDFATLILEGAAKGKRRGKG
jgi:hypothetical protein